MTVWPVNRTKWKSMRWPQSILANVIYKNNLLARWKNLTNSSPIFHSKTNDLPRTVEKSSLRQRTFLCSVMGKEVLHWISVKSGFLFLYSLLSLLPFQSIFLIMCSYINKNGSSVNWVRRWGVNWQAHAKSPQYLHFVKKCFCSSEKEQKGGTDCMCMCRWQKYF